MLRGNLHIYQRAADWGMIFYSEIDRIVYYTLFAVEAKKYEICVLAASLMYTHTHQTIKAKNLRAASKYVQDASSAFARAYNAEHHRKGPLFYHEFGRAWKMTEKEKRTNIAYVINNHVEKHLCTTAQEYRWSFVAYALSKNPFSAPVDRRTASMVLKRLMRLVSRRAKDNLPLTYRHLHKMEALLNPDEMEQLTDFIITEYDWISFGSAAVYYGDIERMLKACEYNTGAEYDIHEEKGGSSDTHYEEMLKTAAAEGYLDKIYTLSGEEKRKLSRELALKTKATCEQIGKFLHFFDYFVKNRPK